MNVCKIDLHMHSNVSDGTDTPGELLEHVREAGIGLFSLTDHDALKGCGMIRRALRPGDPQFLNGVEFSCRDREGKYHILGYGCDPDSAPMQRIVGKGHEIRVRKVIPRLDFIREHYGFVFPEDEVNALLALDNPGKPHIGNLMVKYGYAKTRDEAINVYLNQVKISSEYVGPEEAIACILQGGGIPVLAHPPFGSGNERITGEELERRLRRLIDYGLLGMECYYSGFTGELRAQMLDLAKRYALYVTAGSDYHGRNKTVAIGETGLDDAGAMPEGMKRFLEDVSYR